MGSRFITMVITAVLLVGLAPQPQAGASSEYFVAPYGSDAAPGTESEPWRTFQHALSRLRPGDVLNARGGTYVEEVRNPSLVSGRSDSPITVRAFAGERPVIKGLFWLRDMDYWRFDGINVTWGSGEANEHMVKLTDGTGWEYVNSEIWGAQSYAGILVATTGGSEPNNWRIAGNCIHDTGENNSRNQDHLIYANSGHQGSGVIEANVMFNAPNGEGVKLGGSSSTEGGASNVTVRYNTIVDTAQSILIAWWSADNLIEGNVLVGVEENNSNIRAFQLYEYGNRAQNNLGAGSKTMFSDYDSDIAVEDAGGNVHGIDPKFSSEGCNGFVPTNPDAGGYGHSAAGWTGGPTADPGGSGDSDDPGEPDPEEDPAGDHPDESSGNYEDAPVDTDSSDRSGTFSDDEGSIFESDIERLAAAGITAGCNPPDNTRFCPDSHVTRGQMAAFLGRALGLSRGSDDRFRDDDTSVFERDIERLAEAGITAGCNPPDNTRFCPDQPVTRAQMASFLVRAREFSNATADFGDISGSIHAADIRALATAGVTKGCNPPENDRFCPDEAVTRGQMAAFLTRAFDL